MGFPSRLSVRDDELTSLSWGNCCCASLLGAVSEAERLMRRGGEEGLVFAW